MKKIKLNDGHEMPLVSFGVFQITDQKQCEEVVLNALEVGFRAIDTAQSYQNEIGVGNALAKTNVKREDIFLTTKIWLSNYGFDKTIASVKESLKKLQTNYLDLVLLHQPFGEYRESFKALVQLQKEGLVKSIGVSNFYDDKLVDLCLFNDYGVTPAVNQIEINPFFQRTQTISKNLEYKVTPQAWAPFAEGRNDIFNNPVLKEIANSKQKTVPQIILGWLSFKNIPFITKSISKDRMIENFESQNISFTKEELDLITSLDNQKSQFFNHNTSEGPERLFELLQQRKNL